MTEEKVEGLMLIAIDEAAIQREHAPVPRDEVRDRPERGTLVVGEGVLTWPPEERRTDRYGFVMLLPSYEAETVVTLIPVVAAPTPGTLWAEVKESRRSDHVGDLFRAIFPRIPQVGDWIRLGSGTLMYGICGQKLQVVGLMPIRERAVDWLNPRALYDVAHQTVVLHFEPTGGNDAATEG